MLLLSRRVFLSLSAGCLTARLHAGTRSGLAGRVLEWSFESGKSYRDPFNEVQLDVVFRNAAGHEQVVPAFWAGEQTWRVRYAGPAGSYIWRSQCSDRTNPDLHGRRGSLEVAAYAGQNPLYRHGPLRTSANRRYFVHADGTPFFWLADTWWMGLTRRLGWPEDFRRLTADRVRKGFNVIQIVAGLYPDMPPNLDERGANEAGLAWETGYRRINPAYFDMADLRIQYLVEQGLVPCIVGSWGYYLPVLGMKKIEQHWRYLVARWGAYPVVWCLAGEGSLPYYLSETREQDTELQSQGWTEMGRTLRRLDPFDRLITVHPSTSSRETVKDPTILDFEMLQTGHLDRRSIPNTVRQVIRATRAEPSLPVINSEVCYEGILAGSRQDIQRFMFWASVLNGACGHTYGANGLWQMNTPEEPFGPSPLGQTWGNTPWQEAYRFPGSRQLGLSAALLRRYEWWRFEPHLEWVEAPGQPSWTEPPPGREGFERPYAAGIPRQVRFVYFRNLGRPPKIVRLETGLSYRAFLFNPMTGHEHPLGAIRRDAAGEWQMDFPPGQHDWVLVLQRER